MARSTFESSGSFHLRRAIDAASISPSGRDLACASASGLHILDLNQPTASARLIPGTVHAEQVVDVQWSPHASRDAWVASICGSRCLLWDVNTALGAPSPMQSHTASITDLNWSPFDVNCLATCSLDRTILLCDVRSGPRGGIARYNYGNDAITQVKWSRADENVFASAEASQLLLWDRRNSWEPLKVIDTEHSQSISGIDWSREYKQLIISCSPDGSIKMWNLDRQDKPLDRTIRTSYPIWRARHTPFGHGILAMATNSTQLDLYDRRTYRISDRDARILPIKSFGGHSQPVKEFLWRYRGGFHAIGNEFADQRDFQLLSYGSDQRLVLHKPDSETFAKLGWEKGEMTTVKSRLTRDGARSSSFRDEFHDKLGHTQDRYLSEMVLTSTSASETFEASQHVERIDALTTSHDDIPDPVLNKAQVDGKDWISELQPLRDMYPQVKLVENAKKRTATITVESPSEKNSHGITPLAISLRFPKAYPQSGIPRVRFLEPHKDQKRVEMARDLASIFTACCRLGQGCLEKSLSYLTGARSAAECLQDLTKDPHGDQSIPSLDDIKDLTDGLDQPEKIQDDDDDDDIVIAGPNSQGNSQILGSDLETRNANAPLPPSCGARFSPGGILVRFSLSATSRERPQPGLRSESDRGQVGKALLEFKSALARNVTVNSSDMMSSRSGDSSSDEGLDSHAPKLLSWEGGLVPPYLAIPDDVSPGVEGKQEDRVRDAGIPHPSFRVNMNEDIEVKQSKLTVEYTELSTTSLKSLAECYQIHGDPGEVASFNWKQCMNLMRTRPSAELKEITDTWHTLSLILANEVPLEQNSYKKHPLLTVAQRGIVQVNHRDAAGNVDESISFDGAERVINPFLRGPVKWGTHPSGYWVVQRMLSRFEELRDVQTLAMLVCVLGKTRTQYLGDAHSLETASVPSLSFDSSDSDSDDDTVTGSIIADSVSIKFKNQDRFDDNNGRDASLLDQSKREVYQTWRKQYSEQLQAWGMHLAKAEILSFNSFDVETSKAQTLTFARDRHDCCVICWEKVAGLGLTCWDCGCVSHASCVEGWTAVGVMPTSCPEGCQVLSV